MKSNSLNTFGQILQDARETKVFSLGRVAEVLGVPKTTLWRWESNKTKVDAQRLIDIAEKCGLSVSNMFEGNILTATTQTDFDRLGIVVEHIERIVQRLEIRPEPRAVRAAVVKILRFDTSRILNTTGSAFDLSRYAAMVSGILGKSS